MAGSQCEVAAAMSRGLARPRAVIAVTGEAGLGKTTLVDAVVAGLAGSAGPVRQVRGATGDVLAAFTELCAAGSAEQPRVPPDLAGRAEAGMSGIGPAPVAAPGILVVDDAHVVPATILRRLAELSNPSSPGRSPPYLVFVAQPEFWSILNSPQLSMLRDRIDVRAVLFPMVYAEAEQYVEHLFRLAGSSARSVLSEDALHTLILRARGNFRQINAELDRVLASGAGQQAPSGLPKIGMGPSGSGPGSRRRWFVALASILATIALAGTAVFLPDASPIQSKRGSAPADLATGLQGMKKPSVDEAAIMPAVPKVARPMTAPPPAAEPPQAASEAPAETPAPREGPAPAMVAVPEARPAAMPAPDSPPLAEGGPATPPQAFEKLPDALIATLIRRGDEMMELKDVSAARRLYQRAAMAGSGRAALALGGTFDPNQRNGAFWDAEPDPDTAIAWYQTAATLGDEEAPARLKRLGGAMP